MIFTLEDARKKIVARLLEVRDAELPDLLIEWDNQTAVNMSTQTEPFLAVTIAMMDGAQVDLAKNPQRRRMGTIVLEATSKEGQGLSKANEILEVMTRAVEMTDVMYPVRTYAARFASRKPAQGWRGQASLTAFWYDSQ